METERNVVDVCFCLVVGYFAVVTASAVRPLETAGTSGEKASLTASATPGTTCTAPPVKAGETALITCSFHKNVYGSDVKIIYYGNDQISKEQDILECYTNAEEKYKCDNKDPQYRLEGIVSRIVRITFTADTSREGKYICFLLPSSQNPSVGCSFNLSSQAQNDTLQTLAEARTGGKEEAGLSTGTVIGIVFGVLGAVTIPVVVGLLLCRKRQGDSVSRHEDTPLATSSN